MLPIDDLLAARSREVVAAPGADGCSHACAGQKKYVNGQLIAKSIDIYLCMEFADGGDVRPFPESPNPEPWY